MRKAPRARYDSHEYADEDQKWSEWKLGNSKEILSDGYMNDVTILSLGEVSSMTLVNLC